jgi:hypothetical protein
VTKTLGINEEAKKDVEEDVVVYRDEKSNGE